MNESIDELIVSLSENAQSILEKKGHLDSVAMIINKENKTIPSYFPHEVSEDKYAMYRALGEAMREFEAERVVIISDAAVRVLYKKKDIEHFKENVVTEQPLLYPKSMRMDGILLLEICPKTRSSEGYFKHYEELKNAPSLFHDLLKLKDMPGMGGKLKEFGGDIFDHVMEGYENPEKKSEVVRVFEVQKTTREDIAKVIAYAKEHKYDQHKMKRVMAGDIKPAGLDPGFIVHIHDGYRMVYSLEQQPVVGWCHHLSISVEKTKKYPHPVVTMEIMKLFGMEGDFKKCLSIWQEEVTESVNILQKVDDES